MVRLHAGSPSVSPTARAGPPRSNPRTSRYARGAASLRSLRQHSRARQDLDPLPDDRGSGRGDAHDGGGDPARTDRGVPDAAAGERRDGRGDRRVHSRRARFASPSRPTRRASISIGRPMPARSGGCPGSCSPPWLWRAAAGACSCTAWTAIREAASGPARRSSASAFPLAGDFEEAASHLRRHRFAYMPLARISAELAEMMDLRPILGLRSPVHTLARGLDPFGRADLAAGGLSSRLCRDPPRRRDRARGKADPGVSRRRRRERTPAEQAVRDAVDRRRRLRGDALAGDVRTAPGADETMDLDRLEAVWRGVESRRIRRSERRRHDGARPLGDGRRERAGARRRRGPRRFGAGATGARWRRPRREARAVSTSAGKGKEMRCPPKTKSSPRSPPCRGRTARPRCRNPAPSTA